MSDLMKKITVILAIVIVLLLTAFFLIKHNLEKNISVDFENIDFKTGESGGLANIKLKIINNSYFKSFNVKDLTVSLFSKDVFIGKLVKPEKIQIEKVTELSMTITEIDPMTLLELDFTKLNAIVCFKKYANNFCFAYDLSTEETTE